MATADEVLEALIGFKRRDRSGDPWDCWKPRDGVGAEATLFVKFVPGNPTLEELLAGFAEMEAHLLELASNGFLQLERTPHFHGDGVSTHVVWFVGPGLERLGSPPAPPKDRAAIQEAIRYVVMERDAFECVLCGAGDDLTLDHIIPVVMGGSNDPINLRVLCRSCNSNKGVGLPDSIRFMGRRDA